MSPAENPKVGQSVEFDASTSTAVTGAIHDYHWTCVPANGVPETVCTDFNRQKEAPANKQKKSFFATFSQPGAVTVLLTLDVKIGSEPVIESLPAEKIINIQPLPTAVSGGIGLVNFTLPNKVIEGVSVELKASGAPTDGTYEWTFFSGATDENSPILHTFETAGVESIILRAYDSSGEQIGGEVTKNVIIASPNTPTAIATMNGDTVVGGRVLRISRGDEVLFASLSCDEFGVCGPMANITQTWKWNGYIVPLEQLDQMTTQMGMHVLTLDVVSKSDPQKKASQSFRIVVENQIPTVEFNVDEDLILGSGFMRFNITADDIDGEIVRYRLQASEYGKLLDTQMIPTSQGTLSTIMDLSSLVGKHEIIFTVEVIDADGGVGKTTKNKTITVDASTLNNQSPTVSIFTTPATTGTTNSVFRFFTQAYDPDGDYLTYTWTFPAGQTVFGKSAVRRFNKAGVYAVKVTVTDGIENVSVIETITVVDDPSGGSGTGGGMGLNGNDGTNGNDEENGISSFIKTSIEPVGLNCESGGIKIDSGNDENRNGQLELLEILSTEYVCNGGVGNNGLDGNDGLDGNGDNSVSSLIKTSVEPAGSNCLEGGMRVEKGIDDNSNEFLDASEVDTTEYVCTGENDSGGGTENTILNKAPQVQISGMSPGNTGNTDTKFSFFSNASDPDGDTLIYEWDFADGSSSTTKNVTHTYSSPGTYQVRLKVSDGVVSREVKISVRVVAVGDTIPESSLPPYEPVYHSSPISSVIKNGNPVVIVSGGANQTEDFSKKIQELATAKKQALLQCKTEMECSSLQQQINLLNAIQQKTEELDNETDSLRRQQLQDEVAVLLSQSKKLDSNVSIATKVEGFLAMKRKALSECTSQVECDRLQKEIDTLLLIQKKITAMEVETDPVRKQQLRDEILALLSPFESATIAIIKGTTNTTFFLYGQINFETDRPLSIEWETGDGRQFSGQDVAWQYSESGLYTVTMIVSDGTANVTDTLTIKID